MVPRSLLVVLWACAVGLASPTAHVFVIIGQSNSIGINIEGHTAEDVTYDNILQTSCCHDGVANNDDCQLILGQDPLHHACETIYVTSQMVGFGMSFARRVHADVPADDLIILVPAGIGATGFNDNVWTAYDGIGFKQALTRMLSTFDLLAKNYPNHNTVLDGFLWHQGENDADVNTSTSDYLNKDLIPMINAWRNSSLIPQTNPEVPFVVGNLVPSWINDPNATQRLGVAAAIQVLDQYVPFTASVPSQGLHGNPIELPTPIHFTADSQRILGKRYYAGWKLAFLNSVI